MWLSFKWRYVYFSLKYTQYIILLTKIIFYSDNNDTDDLYLDTPQIRRRNDDGIILEADDFDDYVTSANDPDILVPEHIYGNTNESQIEPLWEGTNTGEFVDGIGCFTGLLTCKT